MFAMKSQIAISFRLDGKVKHPFTHTEHFKKRLSAKWVHSYAVRNKNRH